MGKDSFRVQTGAKKIEVNDDGEFITLNLGDQSFLPRFAALKEKFEAQEPELKRMAEQIDAMPEETDDQKFQKTKAALECNQKIHESFRDEVDNVFGAETCRKVFGSIVPSVDMYTDFFQNITPYIEKYATERNQKISKYGAGRVGNA